MYINTKYTNYKEAKSVSKQEAESIELFHKGRNIYNYTVLLLNVEI